MDKENDNGVWTTTAATTADYGQQRRRLRYVFMNKYKKLKKNKKFKNKKKIKNKKPKKNKKILN